jgi:hypothetical protein
VVPIVDEFLQRLRERKLVPRTELPVVEVVRGRDFYEVVCLRPLPARLVVQMDVRL